MKVLWITNSPSGVAATVGRYNKVDRGWIDALEQRLCATGVVDLAVAFPFPTDDIHSVVQDGIEYWMVPATVPPPGFPRWWRRMRHRVDDPRLQQGLLDVAHQVAPDIIQVWGTEDAYGLLAPLMPAPVVIHIQGSFTVCTKKRFTGIPFKDVLRTTKPLQFLRGRGPIHDYFEAVRVARRETEVFSACRYFMGRTDWDRRLTSVLAPGARYYHCDEVLRDCFWEERWQPHVRDRFVFSSTIMGAPYKGFETVCECAQMLRQAGLVNFEWRVVGLSQDCDTARTVQHMLGVDFASLGIVLPGKKAANALMQGLLDSDIYVHPSHVENSANSICEAMLLGMPVVATSAGGTPSLITDGHDGLLVSDSDPSAMAGALLELIRDRELAWRLGTSARERAIKRHDPGTIVRTLLGIYQDILERELSGDMQTMESEAAEKSGRE